MTGRLTVDGRGARVDYLGVPAGSTRGIHQILLNRDRTPRDLSKFTGSVTFKDGVTQYDTISAPGGLLLDASGNIETVAFAQYVTWRYAKYQVKIIDPYGNVEYPFFGTYSLTDT